MVYSLTIDLVSYEKSQINVYDSNGKLVYSSSSAGNELYSLDISNLNSGMYSVEGINGYKFL